MFDRLEPAPGASLGNRNAPIANEPGIVSLQATGLGFENGPMVGGLFVRPLPFMAYINWLQ